MIDRFFIDTKPCLVKMEPPAMKSDQVPSMRQIPEEYIANPAREMLIKLE